MNTRTSLPTAILSFAFTGVMGPHARLQDYEPSKVRSVSPPVPIASARTA